MKGSVFLNIHAKRATSVALAAAFMLSAGWSADALYAENDADYKHYFTDEDIMTVELTIDADGWQDMLDNAMDEEYHEADITVNGDTLESVGIRTKGNSSLSSVASSDSDRYSFRIKTNKYVKGQKYDGMSEFVLNSQFADPSYMREYLTYEAMAYLGGITPYVSYCNLYVNGELFGFYLCIETIDNSFTERHTDAEDAALYKADGERCTLLSDMELSQFESKYGSDDNLDNIQQLVDVLNQDTVSKEELDSIVDASSVLKAIAINTVMGNYDSYSGSKAHNYYLLYEDGIFYYVGWDYNMSIGGFMEGGSSSVIADITTPIYGTILEQRPLFEKVLAIDEYYEEYLGYVQELVDYFSDFETMVADLREMIDSYVEADPTAYYTYDQYVENITASGTDLTTETDSGMGDFPSDFQMPEGDFSGMQEGEMPDFSQMQPPSDDASGERPEMGEDGDFSQDGGPGGGMPGGGMGGGMISNIPVSIMDYIPQRVTNIQGQLDGTYTGEVSTGNANSGMGRGNGMMGQQGGNEEVTASATDSTVTIDGTAIDFSAYNINGNNYFKLRDLAYALSGSNAQFNVIWDHTNQTILVTSGVAYNEVGGEMSIKDAGEVTTTLSNVSISLDGESITVRAYKIGGNYYFMLRDVAEALNISVTYEGNLDNISISTTSSYQAE